MSKTAEAVHVEVVATKKITEEGFNGKKPHTHARPGDRGTIVHVDEGIPVVRFHRTGTATSVALFENAELCVKVD